MSGMAFFDLAARQASWLAARQSVIAGNVANAHTPGFKARDLKSFEDTLARTQLTLAATSPAHLGAGDAASRIGDAREIAGWETHYSGNSVSLEQQMSLAGDTSRRHALNLGLSKAFHRMYLTGVKG